jgi:phage repressor protein C with HTH and peptisase S24 domain
MNIIQLHPHKQRNVSNAPIEQDSLQVMQVSGDSMVPNYYPRDHVLVDTAHTFPCDGDFVILNECGALAVKKLQVMLSTPKIRVISTNKIYESYEVDQADVCIVGKVVGKWERK